MPACHTIPRELNLLAPVKVGDLIRLGNANDGGYVIPKSIVEKTEFLVSMGVCDDWSFEEAYLKLVPQLKIHAYDHTISHHAFKKAASSAFRKVLRGKCDWQTYKKRKRVFASYEEFFSKHAKHFEERIYNTVVNPNDATIDKVMGRTESNRVFVKMDIECGEYRVIRDLVRHSSRIIGMAIEFHEVDPYRLVVADCVQMLLKDYEVVHIHANNRRVVSPDGVPDILEVTFARKDFVTTSERRTRFPVDGVDAPNLPEFPDVEFEFNLA